MSKEKKEEPRLDKYMGGGKNVDGEDPFFSILAKRYASAVGLSEEEARAILLAMKEREPSQFEMIRQLLGVMAEFGDRISDPSLLPLIQPMIQMGMQKVMGDGTDIDPFFKNLMKYMAGAQIVSSMGFQSQFVQQLLKKVEELEKKLEEKRVEEVKRELEERVSKIEDVLTQLIEKLEKGEIETSGRNNDELLEEIRRLRKEIEDIRKESRDVDYILEKLKKEEEKARKILELKGYRIEKEPSLSIKDLEEIAKKYGLKLEKASVPLDEVLRMKKKIKKLVKKKLKEAYQKGYEKALEELDAKQFEQQLKTVENIVMKSIDKVIETIIGPIIQNMFTSSPEKAVETAKTITEAASVVKEVVSSTLKKAGVGEEVAKSVAKATAEAVEEASFLSD